MDQSSYQVNKQKALSLLRDPADYPSLRSLRNATLKLQLYVIPAFEPHITWSVYQLETKEYVVRRMRWDHNMDRNSEISGPTLYASDSNPEKRSIDDMLTQLSHLSFTPFEVREHIGLDGITYGVRYHNFMNFCEFCWWDKPPAGCEELALWYHQFIELLESTLPAHTDGYRTGFN